MLTEDIARDLEPEAASTAPALERPSAARPYRGHHAKIAAAVAALRAEGLLPERLRPTHRDRRICDWLMAAGYAEDLAKSAIAWPLL